MPIPSTHRSVKPPTQHLKCLLILIFFLITAACGDDERRGSGQPDDQMAEEQKEAQKKQACETACAHVYDTCHISFIQSDGTPASHETCIDACVNKNFLKGNESCVANASCSYSEFVECIRREPEPEPEPEPSTLDCGEADKQWSAVWKVLEEEVLTEVNRVRASGARCADTDFGPAPPMKMDPALRCSSRLFSKDMAVRGFFDHTSPDGTEPKDRIAAAKYTGTYPIGENIAVGYSSAAEVMHGWMNSPGHCRNIMNPQFLELGVGYYYHDPDAQRYKHYWTQNFGGGRP